MILHVLNASPASAAFRQCVNIIESGDALVLMGDGVYAALEGTGAYGELLATGARVHLLRSDATAAGVAFPTNAMEVIDMDGFVSLTERFPRQLCWY
jgi:tRNA 2-thiouridine synthesizing protein B